MTALEFGKLATHSWSMFVDRAASFGRVQELASAVVDRILPMSQHAAISLDDLGEPLFSTLIAQFEPSCEPRYITFGDDDVFV